MDIPEDFGAFVPGQRFRIEGRAGGPLAGLTFAAKDLFDVAGRPTGGGNPDWARANPVPIRHAWAVETLLDAGATLIGKTVTDDVSLGILGENPFDGTPMNPRAPGHVPGGTPSASPTRTPQRHWSRSGRGSPASLARCARKSWRRPVLPPGRERSARCSPTKPCRRSRRGSTVPIRASSSASHATWRSPR